MTKNIAMFIHHESGGTITAFQKFMKIFRENNYIIDLYRINKDDEKFASLSKFADNEFNSKLDLDYRIKSRLPLFREYYNTYKYTIILSKLDRISKVIAEK
jgi:hypothetical protein